MSDNDEKESDIIELGVLGTMFAGIFYEHFRTIHTNTEVVTEELFKEIARRPQGARLLRSIALTMEKKYVEVLEQLRNPDNTVNVETLAHWRRLIRYVREYGKLAFATVKKKEN